MNSESVRKRKTFTAAAEILAIGTLYALAVSFTKVGIPCVFHLLTGYMCPGCGTTRMCMHLIQGNLGAAWQDNPFTMLLIIPGLLYAIAKVKQYIKKGEMHFSNVEIAALLILLAASILFGFWRNGLIWI